MSKNTKKIKPIIQKLRFKYRVSVLNENTLEESWHIRLSRFTVIVYGMGLLFTTFLVLTILIFTTPVSKYLPGYGDAGNRTRILQETLRADTLVQKMKLQEQYIVLMKNIIAGNIKPDSIASLDKNKVQEIAHKLITKSEAEQEFIEKFENDEKYNLQTIEDKPQEVQVTFFKPVNGVLASTFNASRGQYGIGVITPPNSSVQSIQAGTIVNTAYTFESGWVIEIQHDNNYLSIYKNNSKILKKTGDAVRAGESIAITGDSNNSKNTNKFYFEIWKQGKPVNPTEYIVF